MMRGFEGDWKCERETGKISCSVQVLPLKAPNAAVLLNSQSLIHFT